MKSLWREICLTVWPVQRDSTCDLQSNSCLSVPSKSGLTERTRRQLVWEAKETRQGGSRQEEREMNGRVSVPGRMTALKQCVSPSPPESQSQCSVNHSFDNSGSTYTLTNVCIHLQQPSIEIKVTKQMCFYATRGARLQFILSRDTTGSIRNNSDQISQTLRFCLKSRLISRWQISQ